MNTATLHVSSHLLMSNMQMISWLRGYVYSFSSRFEEYTQADSRSQWRQILLNNRFSDGLLASDASVKLLQSSIDISIQTLRRLELALGKMLNSFSAPGDASTNAVCCLRASLQVHVIYSITSSNFY